jgi:SET domain-containing protein
MSIKSEKPAACRLTPADVSVRDSPGRGRGVFATRRFEEGETIEICPVIALSETDARTIDTTKLYDYYYGWGDGKKGAAIALGYGSLYNHSFAPNATYSKCMDDSTIMIIAIKAIASEEEIFINYNTGAGSSNNQLWFEVK